ncbi:MAG: TraB/GumN family protein [Myxococcota bacterium]
MRALPLLLLAASCAPKLPVPSSADGAVENPLLLWRVEKAGHTSHLLGTCHVGVSLDYALPKPHDAALDRARVVYTEAELNMDDIGGLVGLLWTAGPGLSTRISEDRWRAVAYAVRDTLPAPLFEHLEPWALATIIPMATTTGGMDGFTKGSMDVEVQKRAKARRIEVRHVETMAEQAALLSAWNDTFLESIGPTTTDTGSAANDALTALCMRADLTTADLILDADDPISEALLPARNRAWMPKLLPALAEGDAFVAVGAAHMLGESGLVALLQAEGFTVSQLTTTRPFTTDRMPPSSADIPPAPPVPAGLDATIRAFSTTIGAAMCADGQLMRTCFEPDLARCTTRLTTDAALCARQHADRLPAEGEPFPPALAQELAACAPVGMVLEAVGQDRVGDGPLCDVIKGAMKGAMNKAR